MRAEYPELSIEIVGVNERGHNVGNPQMTDGRDLPFLQDVDADGNSQSDVWLESWDVDFRDVVVLNGANEQVDLYNLTFNDLANPANYAHLYDLLVTAAIVDQRPWCNSEQQLDVDDDGDVTIDDAEKLLDALLESGSHELPDVGNSAEITGYYDCNFDGFIAPNDLLQIVNFLFFSEASGSEGEGEATSRAGERQAEMSLPPAPKPAFAFPLAIAERGETPPGDALQQANEMALPPQNRPGRADFAAVPMRELPPVIEHERSFGSGENEALPLSPESVDLLLSLLAEADESLL